MIFIFESGNFQLIILSKRRVPTNLLATCKSLQLSGKIVAT